MKFLVQILSRNILMTGYSLNRLRVHGLNGPTTHTHTKTHPEIQVYEEMIIYKIKSFIMHSPTRETYPGKIQN